MAAPDALACGQLVGIVYSTDGHKNRPGASHTGASEFSFCGRLTSASWFQD